MAHLKTNDVLWESVTSALIWGIVAGVTIFVWRGDSASPAEAIMAFLDIPQAVIFLISCIAAWILMRLLGVWLGGEADERNGLYFGRIALSEIGATLTTAGSILIACVIAGGGLYLLVASFMAYYYGYLFRSEFSPNNSFKPTPLRGAA